MPGVIDAFTWIDDLIADDTGRKALRPVSERLGASPAPFFAERATLSPDELIFNLGTVGSATRRARLQW